VSFLLLFQFSVNEIQQLFREKLTCLFFSDDDDEYDQGVHLTMPEADMRRASVHCVNDRKN